MKVIIFSKDKLYLTSLQRELKAKGIKVVPYYEDVEFIQCLHALKYNEKVVIIFDMNGIENPLVVPNLINAVHKNIFTIVCTLEDQKIADEFRNMGVQCVLPKAEKENLINKMLLLYDAYNNSNFIADNEDYGDINQLLNAYRMHTRILRLQDNVETKGSHSINWYQELQRLRVINEDILKAATKPITQSNNDVYNLKNLFNALVKFWELPDENVKCEVDSAFVSSDPNHIMFILDEIVQCATYLGVKPSALRFVLIACTNDIKNIVLVVKLNILSPDSKIINELKTKIDNGLFERLCRFNGVYYDVQIRRYYISIEFTFENLVENSIYSKVVNV